jgi:hypothetical protein
MASFFCQELIKNTHTLCTSYINRLLAEKSVRSAGHHAGAASDGRVSRQRAPSAQDGNMDLLQDEHQERLETRSLEDEDINSLVKKTSYYVEENEKLLNVLITNCEPILSELSSLITHFNSYNKI